MRVIGIDPGYERLGVAILEKKGGKEILLFSDCLQTDSKSPLSQRIFLLGQEVENIIKKWQPDALSIEKLFFTTNQKTAMGVSEVRGAIIYIAQKSNLKIFEYTPLQVKIAVTGYGKAEKSQVKSMLEKILKIESNKKRRDDEFDAMAIGLTCLVSTPPLLQKI